MKKLISILLILFTMFSFSSCKKEKEEPLSGIYEKVSLNDFEESSDFDLLRVSNRLGKIKMNSEEKYVKSGKSSCELFVTGDSRYLNPKIFQPLNVLKKEDYSDLSNCAVITFWLFNDGEKTTVDLDFDFAEGNIGTTTYELPANEWTQVTYKVNREIIPSKTCNGIFLTFQKELDNGRHIFLDDLNLFFTEGFLQPTPVTLSEHEIMSFDKFYQHSLLKLATDSTVASLYPNVSISQEHAKKQKDFNMKVVAPKGTDSVDFGSTNWPGIEIHEDIIGKIDWSLYDDNDVFSFDYYSPKEGGMDKIWVSFYNLNEMRYFVSDTIYCTYDRWKTVSFSVRDLNSQVERADLYGFSSTYRIVIRWGEFNDYDKTIYFNNFKMQINPYA